MSILTDQLINVEHVTKKYGRFKALRDATFTANQGEIHAVLGPNGAGKTTLFRCMLGLLNFEGSITVANNDVRKGGKWIRGQVGYLPQHSSPYDDMTVEQNLKYYAGLKRINPSRVEESLKEIRLTRFRERKAGALSGGMKQRLMLGISQLSDPPILILDEPTANLDVQGQLEFRQLLGEILEKGKCVLVSTHLLREAHEIRLFKGHVLVVNKGRVVQAGGVEDFMKDAELKDHLFIDTGNNNPNDMAKVVHDLGFKDAEVHKAQIVVSCNHEEKFKILKGLCDKGFSPDSFRVEEPSLEKAFMQMTSDDLKKTTETVTKK
jgi:ABC-type multidrug transport system ATPase subunit|tara:strand:+ start:5510 stop:6472 length:963 start_codon:yes stop_codon:yes gene_type:complete